MSNRFYFGSPNDSDADLSDNDTSLPFPKPIDRSAFLAPDFDPTSFLSSLADRFQTLEDLQTELRDLVQSLNKGLVDLVNNNYQEFLSLGNNLSGGEERVEEVRVGLLGFQRDITGVRDKVESRRNEIAALLEQKKDLRREIGKGRILLEIAERIEDLEYRLRIAKPGQRSATDQESAETSYAWDDDWDAELPSESDDEFDDSNDQNGTAPHQRFMVERYMILKLLASKHDSNHPFLVGQQSRLDKIHDTIRVDLETGIRQEEDVKGRQKLIQLRSMLDD